MKSTIFNDFSVELFLISRFSVSPSHSLVKDVSAEKLEEKLREAESETLQEIIDSKLTTPVSTTPSPTPTTPGPTTGKSHSSISPVSISANSIQAIPPFKPRKSKEWTAVEVNVECNFSM